MKDSIEFLVVNRATNEHLSMGTLCFAGITYNTNILSQDGSACYVVICIMWLENKCLFI